MNCKICGSSAKLLWTKQVLNKYQGEYYQCQNCDFLFVANPFWLGEAYEDPINVYDTGLMYRNLRFSDIVATYLKFFFSARQQDFFLDYSGGYGIFVRLMRDRGFNFLWKDEFAKNLVARGFEYRGEKISFCTCFEVLEHAPDPHVFIAALKQLSPVFLVSTELVPASVSPDWHYLGTEHGQHICFFSVKSLMKLAELNHLYVTSHGSLHLFSQKKILAWRWMLTLAASKVFGSRVKLRGKISAIDDSEHLKKIFTP